MLAKKIAINTIISSLLRILGTVMALFIVGLLTRYFTKAAWGEYNIVMTLGSIFTVVAEFGFYQIMVREISRPGADEEKISSNIFTLRLIFSLFIFFLAPLLSVLLPYSNQVRWGIFLGMFGFWFLSGGQVLTGVFQKYLRMDKIAIAETVGRLLQLFLTILLIKKGFGFLPIIAVLSFSSLANFLLIVFFVKKYVKLRLSFDFSFWRGVLVQSYPLAVSNILVMVYFSFGAFLLSIFKPAEDVGIFRLSFKVLESLIFFPAMFVGLIMPLLSGSINLLPRFRKIFQRSFDLLFVFAWPLALGVFMLAGPIISLLGGSEYNESVAVLQILMFAVVAIFSSTLFSYSLVSLNQQKKLLFISAFGAVFNLVSNLIFIPRYSYLAVAWASLLTEVLVAVCMAAVIYSTVKIRPSFTVGAKSLFAALAMSIFLWFFNGLNLFLLIMLGAFIYFAVLFLVGGIKKEEFLMLIKRKNEDSFA
jgi:O-antigen/teichoic acid export membrane protein